MSKRNCRNCGNLNLCSLAKKTYELDGMLTLVTTEYNEEAFDKAPNLIVDLFAGTMQPVHPQEAGTTAINR